MTRSATALFALASVAAVGRAWDASEWLTEEGKRDASAYDPAKCWCDKITAAVSDRITHADQEIQNLESTSNVAHYENEQLKLEVQEHKGEAADHSEALDTASAISAREGAAGQDEVTSLEASVNTIKAAMDKVQEGSQVHGTLKGLADSFEDRLEEAKSSDESRQSKFDDLEASRKKMLDLSRKAAAAKEARLAEGLAVVSRANTQIDRYSTLREDDAAFSTSASDLCSMLADQSDKRQGLRQASNIAVSKAKVAAAEQQAMHAANQVMNLLSRRTRGAKAVKISAHSHARAAANATLLIKKARAELAHLDCAQQLEHAEEDKRRATEALEGAKKTASDLMDLVDQSSGIQQALEQMLHGTMTAALVAEGHVASEADVKASVAAIFDTTKSQLSSLAAPFDALRAKGKASTLAASRLVTALLAAEADASQAVVDARRCHE